MFYYVIKLILKVVDVFRTVKDLSNEPLFSLATDAHGTYCVLLNTAISLVFFN